MRQSSVQIFLAMLISSALVLSIGGCQSPQLTQEDEIVFVHEPTDAYTEMRKHGFTVLVSTAAMEHQESTEPALKLLEQKLGEVLELTPEHTHGALREVRFWLEHENPGFPCACYHPGAQWLSENGYNTDKVGGIEITNAKHFVQWTNRDQPLMVLHELAHAYHDRVLGFNNKLINRNWKRALTSKKYDEVMHVSGKPREHYAKSNDREYFAELTESYFGKNDFAPFTRDELKSFDPDGYEMIMLLWLRPHPSTTFRE